jgi:hypothetical protein
MEVEHGKEKELWGRGISGPQKGSGSLKVKKILAPPHDPHNRILLRVQSDIRLSNIFFNRTSGFFPSV